MAAATAERLVREQFAIIETGQLELAAGNVTADFANHCAATEPPAAGGDGPAALQATAEWLRTAFSDLHFEIHATLCLRTARSPGSPCTAPRLLRCRLRPGRRIGRERVPNDRAQLRRPAGALVPDRRRRDAEHDAVRDDLAVAAQVGWFPPRPSYVVRTLLARRRYRRPPTPET